MKESCALLRRILISRVSSYHMRTIITTLLSSSLAPVSSVCVLALAIEQDVRLALSLPLSTTLSSRLFLPSRSKTATASKPTVSLP